MLHVGEGVEAHVVKLAVNMVIGAYASAMYEALTLCLKDGVDESTYLGILNESVIGTPCSRYKAAGLVDHDYTPGHTISGLDKDFGLIELTAGSLGVATPITALVRQQIRAAVGRGEGALDMTALLEQCLRDAGLPAVSTATSARSGCRAGVRPAASSCVLPLSSSQLASRSAIVNTRRVFGGVWPPVGRGVLCSYTVHTHSLLISGGPEHPQTRHDPATAKRDSEAR